MRKDEIPDGFQELTVFLEVTGRRSVNKINQKPFGCLNGSCSQRVSAINCAGKSEYISGSGRSFRR